jgi:hypothetical protein
VHIEDGAYDESTAEGEEHVDADDPTDGAFAVIGKLVLGEVGLVDSDCVHQTQRGDKTAEGSEHHEPCT